VLRLERHVAGELEQRAGGEVAGRDALLVLAHRDHEPLPVAAAHPAAAPVAQRDGDGRRRRPLREQLGHAIAEAQRTDRAFVVGRDLRAQGRIAGGIERESSCATAPPKSPSASSACARARSSAAAPAPPSPPPPPPSGFVVRTRARRFAGASRRCGAASPARRRTVSGAAGRAAPLRETRVDRDLLVDQVFDDVGLLDAVPPRIVVLSSARRSSSSSPSASKHALLRAEILTRARISSADLASARLDLLEQIVLRLLVGVVLTVRLVRRTSPSRSRLLDPALRLVAAPRERPSAGSERPPPASMVGLPCRRGD